MPDDKSKIGGQDKSRVAENEEYEIQYLVQKTGASAEQVRQAIQKVGNEREKIEKYLNNLN